MSAFHHVLKDFTETELNVWFVPLDVLFVQRMALALRVMWV